MIHWHPWMIGLWPWAIMAALAAPIGLYALLERIAGTPDQSRKVGLWLLALLCLVLALR
jgi:hypothetical protein